MRWVLSFLVWLFSFWTWKDFLLRWLRSPGYHPPSGETSEPLLSQQGQPESELARFLSSLPEHERQCRYLIFDGDSKVRIRVGHSQFTLIHGTGVDASYVEFLEAVASSEIVLSKKVIVFLLEEESCKHVEAFADALPQSGNGFKELHLWCWNGSIVQFAKCVSNVLLSNDAIQVLHLNFEHSQEEMGKDLVKEFMAIIGVPYNLQSLKSFGMHARKLDGEGMEQLMKPFQGPSHVLEKLIFDWITSDAQLKHISDMLASSTSLKTLEVNVYSSGANEKAFTSEYTNIAIALCSNQSLEALSCGISTSLELKALLDPLVPKANNLQCNTTLTELNLWGSVGEKEGIKTLVDMVCTNSSLLELALIRMDDLSLPNKEGIENILTILEALKTNKSLKRIGLQGCKAVGGYKVLGTMMDLLLQNHCIEEINLSGTCLEDTRDADYVSSPLSKRKKVKLWDIIQGMANVKPTFGRVFLCGNPYAGKTRLRMSMKELEEFQGKEEIQKCSRIQEKIKKRFQNLSKPFKCLKSVDKGPST